MALVKDPVRPGDRREVYTRDRYCIAPQRDPTADPCRNKWGIPVTIELQILAINDWESAWATAFRAKTLSLDHVPKHAGSTRISLPRWMVLVCWGHGVLNGQGGGCWVTGHRRSERDYLELLYGKDPEQ